MRICDLGEIDETVLLFGGPYSNMQALGALLDWSKKAAIPNSRLICTGDIVAYCADAAACIETFRRAHIPLVAGNCEIQLARGAGDCGCGFAAGSQCDRLSGGWYGYASHVVSPDQRVWLATLPDRVIFRHQGQRYVVLHGGASDISRFLWPISSEDDFWYEISILQEEVGAFDGVISGHCGVAFERRIDGIHWINPGVIGLPANDGQQETAFAVLKNGGLEFERLTYDVSGAVAAMKTAGLAAAGYAKALTSGYWPSQDVLPKSMRRKH